MRSAARRESSHAGFRAGVALGTLAALLGLPARARADGAFPDADTILAPSDRPSEIVLITNFGFLMTEDDGATWVWSCEQDANSFGSYYQMGLPPRRRLHGVANMKAIFTDDGACTWALGGGMAADHDVADVWVDRTVVGRTWAITRSLAAGATLETYSVFESNDDGSTYTSLRYASDPGNPITGVESARSDASVVYLTMSAAGVPAGSPPSPILLRTADEGATWQPRDLTESLGTGNLRLLGVDIHDAMRVYLLFNGGGSSLAVTTDGGASAQKTLMLPAGVFRAYAQMDDGTLVVSSELDGETTLHRSDDGGLTFQDLANPPHVRGLAARGGVLYAATDNVMDGYAVQKSLDRGATWTGVMSYDQVKAISSCMKDFCQDTCTLEVSLEIWSDAVCSMDAPTGITGNVDAAVDAPSDAGMTTADAALDVGSGSGGAGTGTGGGGGGCSCLVAVAATKRGGARDLGAGRSLTGLAVVLLVAGEWMRRRRRRRRGGEGPRTRIRGG